MFVAALKVADTFTPSTYRLGVLPAPGAGMAKSGLLLPVISSVLLTPVSVAAVISGATAIAGAVASTVKISPLAVLLLPAASVAVITGV